MRRLLAFGLAALALAGCHRAVRVERLSAPVEAHAEVSFHSDAPRWWDFGDGSPRVEGQQVTHRFAGRGHRVVRAYDGARVTDQVELDVGPRLALHAVPREVVLAAVAPAFDALGPALDFGERLVGASAAGRGLDAVPAVAFALEQGAGGASAIDPAGGAGLFAVNGLEGLVSFAAVLDEGRAISELGPYLRKEGWEALPDSSPPRWTRGPQALVALVDRGVLFVFVSDEGPVPLPSLKAVLTSPDLGLATEPGLLDELTALKGDGPWLFTRSAEPAGPWRHLVLRATPARDTLVLEGRVAAPAPLWTPSAGPRLTLLDHAPGGPIAVLAADVDPARLLMLSLGGPKSPSRAKLEAPLSQRGVNLEAALAALTGTLQAVAWLDAEAFFRGVLENGGRPEPRFSFQLEAGARAAAPLAVWLDSALEGQGGRYTLRAGGHAIDLILTDASLRVEAGAPPHDREPVDLPRFLTERYPFSFAPGHASLYLDVAQVRRDLETPVRLEGVDPRKVIAAQALSVTFLDQLTTLERVMIDVAPDPAGAVVHAVVEARTRSTR